MENCTAQPGEPAAGLGYLTKIDTALSRFRLCGPDFFAFHLDAKARNITDAMNGRPGYGCEFAADRAVAAERHFLRVGY